MRPRGRGSLLVSVVEARDQAGCVPAAAAHLLHLGVELVDDGGDGQAHGGVAGGAPGGGACGGAAQKNRND